MSEQQLADSVRNALNSAVASYGVSVLSDPQALGDVASRMLPGMPHARNLLMAAAGANIATALGQQLQQQTDPAAAVRQAARELGQRTGTDPASSEWVTAEFARALGYPVDLAAAPPPSPSQPGGYGAAQPGYGVQPPGYGGQQPGQPAGYQQPGYGFAAPDASQSGYGQQQPGYGQAAAPQPEAQQSAYQPTSTMQPSAQQPGYASPAPVPPAAAQQPGYAPPAPVPPAGAQQPGYAPPAPVPPAGAQEPGYASTAPLPPYSYQQSGGWQPSAPAYQQRRSGSGGRTALISIIVVVAAVAAYVGIAAGTHLFPFTRSGSGSPSASGTRTPTTRSTSSSSLPPGLAGLDQLLPGVIDDPTTECTNVSTPYHWKMTGVVGALVCDQVPGLPNGLVFAYQLDTAADYQTAWQNYNEWWGFDAGTAGTDCPPASGNNAQGTTGYSNTYYPQRSGQVLECETVSSNQPAYTWTIPTENAFIVAQGASNSSFSALDTWWTDSATPAAAPTPGP